MNLGLPCFGRFPWRFFPLRYWNKAFQGAFLKSFSLNLQKPGYGMDMGMMFPSVMVYKLVALGYMDLAQTTRCLRGGL